MSIRNPDEIKHNNPAYALIDDSEQRGGYRTVINITELKNISFDKRKTGMRVTVVHYNEGDENAVTGGAVTGLTYTNTSIDDVDFEDLNNWEQDSGGGTDKAMNFVFYYDDVQDDNEPADGYIKNLFGSFDLFISRIDIYGKLVLYFMERVNANATIHIRNITNPTTGSFTINVNSRTNQLNYTRFDKGAAGGHTGFNAGDECLVTILQGVDPAEIAHDDVGTINLAGSGITYGHINDQAQTIEGSKTFASSVQAGPAINSNQLVRRDQTEYSATSGNININPYHNFFISSSINVSLIFSISSYNGASGNIIVINTDLSAIDVTFAGTGITFNFIRGDGTDIITMGGDSTYIFSYTFMNATTCYITYGEDYA